MEREEYKKALNKVTKRIAEVELRIEALETAKDNIELELSKPSVYSDTTALLKYNTELSKTQKNLAAEMQAWENESAEQDRLNGLLKG